MIHQVVDAQKAQLVFQHGPDRFQCGQVLLHVVAIGHVANVAVVFDSLRLIKTLVDSYFVGFWCLEKPVYITLKCSYRIGVDATDLNGVCMSFFWRILCLDVTSNSAS